VEEIKGDGDSGVGEPDSKGTQDGNEGSAGTTEEALAAKSGPSNVEPTTHDRHESIGDNEKSISEINKEDANDNTNVDSGKNTIQDASEATDVDKDKTHESQPDTIDSLDTMRQQLDEALRERDGAVAKVAKLESRIRELTSENAILRSQLDDHTNSDLSLSPPQDTVRVSRAHASMYRPRKTSFVEVELYGEASKISDIRRQMEQWRGYQVDMRQWRSVGIGPAIDL
jgi:hypothetical protein